MVLRAAWVCAFTSALSGINATVIGQDEAEPGFGIRLRSRVQHVNADPEPSAEAELSPDAREILNRYQAEAKEIRLKAEKEISVRREATIQTLQVLQDRYTREAKLDEAVAIRDKLRILRFAHLNPRRNPGTLSGFRNKIGKTFYFDVTGVRQGSVWGTEVYTYDSTLASAAVHAGVLKAGHRGIVKVTMIESPDVHTGSVQNGLTSMDFGPFAASFTVERPLPTDVGTNDVESTDEPPEPEVLFLGDGRVLRLNPGF